MVDPADLAARLPNRPLKPTEVEEIADAVGFSTQQVTHKTESGATYVPLFFVFDSQGAGEGLKKRTGDVYVLRMNENLSAWSGIVAEEGINGSEWLDVVKEWAGKMGYEIGEVSMKLDDPDES